MDIDSPKSRVEMAQEGLESFQAAMTEGLGCNAPHPGQEPKRVTDPRYQGLAEDKGYDQSYSRIAKTRYSHESMIDLIIAQPGITQNQLSAAYGYSVPWISRVIGSDAFQAALAKRREDLSNPILMASMEDKIRGLADRSLDILAEKLEATQSADLALKTGDMMLKAMGFGARPRDTGPGQTINFVVAMPEKARSESAWAENNTTIPNLTIANVPPAQALSSTISRDPTIQPEAVKLAGSEGDQ